MHRSRVLTVRPVGFRANDQTAATNTFQRAIAADAEGAALAEHAALVSALRAAGVDVVVVDGDPACPDACFCNNWFSVHDGAPPAVVLYPMLAPNRRAERFDLSGVVGAGHRLVDLTAAEAHGRFLEGTGSLVLDRDARVAYAAWSPRTDAALAAEWASRLGWTLVGFDAADAAGRPYYHTNVLMFLGHGLAGVCFEALPEADRARVAASLRGHELLRLTRAQVAAFSGNVLALDGVGPIWLISASGWGALDPGQRRALESRGAPLVVDLPTIESVGGGSARCLVAELTRSA